mmetsp:Transcript_37211/g.120454  ORF Transcript_37211/g.120454 Transcript_37211/m.120454 type:complete len:678 (+) Transcript_37211:39-2072(+)
MGVPKGPMRVPLELGAKLMCRWRGEEYKSCEIIERKQKSLPDGTTDPSGEWEYYVHYEGLNRRLDEWVGLERFDLGSVNDDGKVTRNSTNKRKHEHEEHEEEGELDLGLGLPPEVPLPRRAVARERRGPLLQHRLGRREGLLGRLRRRRRSHAWLRHQLAELGLLLGVERVHVVRVRVEHSHWSRPGGRRRARCCLRFRTLLLLLAVVLLALALLFLALLALHTAATRLGCARRRTAAAEQDDARQHGAHRHPDGQRVLARVLGREAEVEGRGAQPPIAALEPSSSRLPRGEGSLRRRLGHPRISGDQDVVEEDPVLHRPQLDPHAADRHDVVWRRVVVIGGVVYLARRPLADVGGVVDLGLHPLALVRRVCDLRPLPLAAARRLALRVGHQRRLPLPVLVGVPVGRRLRRRVWDLKRLVGLPRVRPLRRRVLDQARRLLVPVVRLDRGGVGHLRLVDPVGGLGVVGVVDLLRRVDWGGERRLVEQRGRPDLLAVDEDLDLALGRDDRRVQVRLLVGERRRRRLADEVALLDRTVHGALVPQDEVRLVHGSALVRPKHERVRGVSVEGRGRHRLVGREELEVGASALERLLEEELELDDQPHALGAERLRKDRADAVLARRRGELEALVGRQCVRQLGFPAEDAVALELQLALVVFVLRADPALCVDEGLEEEGTVD